MSCHASMLHLVVVLLTRSLKHNLGLDASSVWPGRLQQICLCKWTEQAQKATLSVSFVWLQISLISLRRRTSSSANLKKPEAVEGICCTSCPKVWALCLWRKQTTTCWQSVMWLALCWKGVFCYLVKKSHFYLPRLSSGQGICHDSSQVLPGAPACQPSKAFLSAITTRFSRYFCSPRWGWFEANTTATVLTGGSLRPELDNWSSITKSFAQICLLISTKLFSASLWTCNSACKIEEVIFLHQLHERC